MKIKINEVMLDPIQLVLKRTDPVSILYWPYDPAAIEQIMNQALVGYVLDTNIAWIRFIHDRDSYGHDKWQLAWCVRYRSEEARDNFYSEQSLFASVPKEVATALRRLRQRTLIL